ncbi:chorismate mutase [Sediminibacillus albus]|uniref:chorismate mutase n=1 Tax=Sediminibacillus albus TaxID=407036 RepID=A0A1G8VN44_9BACI|nr:chorismate mutase [Sediminibacillus albus]SDJ67481.1 chorismate mutase [Sediminibacillus albus]
MIRGIRGATTVSTNASAEIIDNTQALVEEMAEANSIRPESIATVLISVTADIDADFPAKALRNIEGWKYVPVMCMKEIDVPGSLEKCIRVMMTVNCEQAQQDVKHIYHQEAVKLRPDLLR